MIRRIAALSFLAISLVFAAGCGGGGTPAVATSGNLTFSASGAAIAFATTSVGASAGAQSVTVTNTGTGALTFSGVALTGANPGDFPWSGSCVGITSLAASASCTLSINFTPTVVGARSATINFQEAGGASHTLSLTGTGTASLADFNPSPGELDFTTTVVGSPSATQTLSFQNSGTGTDTITSVAITGTNTGDFSQTNNCSALAANASCTITVTFTPAATGARTAAVTVTDNSNGTVGTTHTALLTGAGVATAAPTVTLSTTALNFTSGTAQSVTVNNTGAVAVTVTNVSLSGANASVFSQSSNCVSTLAVGASCSISVTFAPGSTSGSFVATLNIADNVIGSPQTVALTATAAPVASLSPTSLTLSSTTLSTASAAQTVTLTNTGTAAMTITGGSSGITLTGTNAGKFALSGNTCTATLAVNASCSVSVTFTPTANGVVTATLSVADNATGSPQTVALTGNGPGAATVTMSLVTVPDDTYNASSPNTMAQVDAFVLSATSTIDMTIYELTDTALIGDLLTQCKTNGVKVRLNLDHSEMSTNQSAYNTIVAGGSNCLAQFSNTHFPNTHEKSIVIDAAIPSKARMLMSTGNFEVGNGTPNYYATGRDFQIYENDANDIAAWETTFTEDWTYPAGTTYPTSPRFAPPTGDNLVWSPTIDGGNSRPAILAVINGATQTLILDQEEMSDSAIISALAAKASPGVVSVKLTIPTGELSSGNLSTLKTAGVKINEYPSSGNNLYIHAKVVLADAGTAAETAYLGSENMSTNSLSSNRELGLILTDSTAPQSQSILQTLKTILTNDFNCVSKPPTQTTPSCTTP